MSQHTPPPNAPEGGEPSQPQKSPKKRSLEDAAAEFIEKGWRLVDDVIPKNVHPLGTIKETRLGETGGEYERNK